MASIYGAGAFHSVVPGWKPVRHKATLRMLERAGFLLIPPEFGQRGRSSIGPVRHAYVREGEKANGMAPFTHKGRTFRLQWADGCFHPFAWEFRA